MRSLQLLNFALRLFILSRRPCQAGDLLLDLLQFLVRSFAKALAAVAVARGPAGFHHGQ